MGFAWRPQVVVLALAALFTSGCAYITRASVDNTGGDANADSLLQSISADGRYVAFRSDASDLVGGDGNSATDVFVRDLRTGTTTRASVDTTGGDADAGTDAYPPAISADGRYVAFGSSASDLVAGGGDVFSDVYVRDLQVGTTTRASVNTAGGEPNNHSFQPSISANGRYVAFESLATDLAPGVTTNAGPEVFVRDLQAGTTTRVMVDTAGGDPNGPADLSSISANGRYVAFDSFASDLVAGDSNSNSDIFVRDLQSATTVRASVDTSGGDPNNRSGFPSISADGRYVAFESLASDLVPNGIPPGGVLVRDLQTGTTTLVGSGGAPSISGDGRYVAFTSGATDLVAGDDNGFDDIFVRDLRTGMTTRVTVDLLGREAHGGPSLLASMSGDGRYVAFDSFASDLVADDGDSNTDIFVAAVVRPTVVSVAPSSVARGTTTTLSVTGSGFFAGAYATASAFGPGGVTVNSISVVSETELELSVSVDAAAPTETRNIIVWNPGTGPGPLATGFGFCSGCLTVT